MASETLDAIYTDYKVRAKDGLKELKVVQAALIALDRTALAVASSIERSTNRLTTALGSLSEASRKLRAPSGGGGGGGRMSDQDKIARDIVRGLEREAKARADVIKEQEKAAEKAAKAAEKTAKAAAKLAEEENKASSATSKLADELGKVGGKGEKAGFGLRAAATAVGNLASGAISKGTGLVIAGLEGATKSAVDFESTLSDLGRVTKGQDDTEAGFKRLKTGILEASKELGRLPQEVGELATALAPVFSGKEDLVGLTKEITKIGVAWGVSGKEAGQFFADISRGMGLSADQTKALFGSINQLANELGVRAAVIAEGVQRSAGVLRASGLSEQTGAALNATLIAAGASAEVAATGVRTFVARLESGSAATLKQRHAFKALGLDAEEVGLQMSKGGKTAEDQITAVVQAISNLPKQDQLPTLIELFGSESIGSIGAAATAVDVLGKSFAIAGDSIAAAGSVQKEFNTASETSAFAIDKLKANIGVLAVQMGEKLLPYVNEIVTWLTSREGQEWGASAVQKAVSAVTTFADALGVIANILTGLIDTFGGATVAIVGMGGALALALGPWGALAAAAVTSIGLIGNAITKTTEDVIELDNWTRRLAENKLFKDAADKVDKGELEGLEAEKAAKELGELLQSKKNNLARPSLRVLTPDAIKQQAELRAKEQQDIELLEREYSRVKYVADKSRKAREEKEAKAAEEAKAKAEEDALVATGAVSSDVESQRISDEFEFDALVREKRKGKLSPSKQKRLTELSKGLDKPIPTGGSGRKGPEKFDSDSLDDAGKKARFDELGRLGKKRKRSEDREYEKLSKELDIRKLGNSKSDRALANISPELAGILRNEEDGGVSQDELSRSVLAAATRGKDYSISGKGDVGPGPNIHNSYDNRSFNTEITQNIDATGESGPTQNLASAANTVGQATSEWLITGWNKILADQNSGGAIR